VDQFQYGDQSENITGKNNCTATTFSGPDLMNLSATGGAVGFVKDGFGVRSSGDGNGEPCGRAEAEDGEQLSVTLGSALGAHLMTAVDLDLELKFNASVDILFKHDGTKVAEVLNWTGMGGSDDGPDSGDLDNFRFNSRDEGVNVGSNTVYFNEVLIVPKSGAVSLEGGADGTDNGKLAANNWSQFEIVKGFDGDINCGDTDPLMQSGVDTSGAVTMHSENLGAGWLVEPNCQIKPYNYWLENDALAFVPELTGTSARYTIEITVKNQAITVDATTGQITSLKAVYDPEPELTFPDGADESALKACLGQPALNMTDQPAYDNFWKATNTGLLPTGESACWYRASVEPTSAGFGTEIWGIYFEDDPGFSFR
jgi:hypothetical protein